MNKNLQALFQKVTESEELQSKFAKASTPEEAYEVAKELQDGFTKEEFLEAAKNLTAALDDELSDEELAFASGGLDAPDKFETLKSLSKGKTKTIVTDKSASVLTRTYLSVR